MNIQNLQLRWKDEGQKLQETGSGRPPADVAWKPSQGALWPGSSAELLSGMGLQEKGVLVNSISPSLYLASTHPYIWKQGFNILS